MPPAAALAVGMGASAIGSIFGANAANKGPRPINPGTNQQYLQNINALSGTAGGTPSVPGQSGYGVNAPSGAAGTLQSMIKTGNPTNVGPAFQALYNAQQQGVTSGRNALLSSFGGAGARYSSTAMQAVGQYENQANLNFLQILSQYTMQAQEAAAQRQLSASEFVTGQQSEAALAYTSPKQSVVGAGLQAGGSNLETMAMLQQLGLLKGSQSNTGSATSTSYGSGGDGGPS